MICFHITKHENFIEVTVIMGSYWNVLFRLDGIKYPISPDPQSIRYFLTQDSGFVRSNILKRIQPNQKMILFIHTGTELILILCTNIRQFKMSNYYKCIIFFVLGIVFCFAQILFCDK